MDESQRIHDEWLNKLPIDLEKYHNIIVEISKKIQTFDLLSCISYYNHLHNTESYSDYRGDKHFFVAEVIALHCLKNDFIIETIISEDDFIETIMKIQDAVLNYCGRTDALEMTKDKYIKDDAISEISYILSREAKKIRNPGLPDHHFIFTEKLFKPINKEIEDYFGFTISESVKIRKMLPELINERCRVEFDNVKRNTNKAAYEISKYRNSRKQLENNLFTEAEFDKLLPLRYKKLHMVIHANFLNKLFFSFSNIYTFSAEELAEYTNIKLENLNRFLKTFSCGFPSLNKEDKIYEPISILKSKPIIVHNGRYFIPSTPLLTWAVEDYIFDCLFSNNQIKTKRSISDIRHDFLLDEAFTFFKKLLPSATFYETNLTYYFDGKKCETDGMFLFDRTLFIVEAKGHRITNRAKKGFEDRTEKHLKEIIQESYNQGIRTLKYIEHNLKSEFKPKKSIKIELNQSQYDDIVIVSLILEPIGNLSMSVKATNQIGYFNDGHFPWIISIYDLIVLADLFDNPFLLIQYIKRRKKFLSSNLLSIYEELDLVTYFQLNGLYTDDILKDAKEKSTNWIQYSPDTDAINDYYMYQFGYKQKFTPKPKFYISSELDNFLLQLDKSKLPHRVRLALLLLEFNQDAIKQFMDKVRITKNDFFKDETLHDCSIYTHSLNGLGVTFMTCKNKQELDYNLHKYCTYKLNELNSNTWIGFGDVSSDPKCFEFKSMYCVIREGFSEIKEVLM